MHCIHCTNFYRLYFFKTYFKMHYITATYTHISYFALLLHDYTIYTDCKDELLKLSVIQLL